MDVMKGVDPTAPPVESAPKKSKKGKERATPESDAEAEVDEDDDDAAWLAKRQAALEGETETYVDPEDALILSTGRLFVRNLAFIATSEDLKEAFGRFGPVIEVHMPVSQQTGEPLGTAFVLFRNPEDALAARKGLDKTSFQGRLLHVLPGRAKHGQEASVAAGAGTTDGKVLGKAAEARGEVKGRQEEKRTAASAKGLNWATLYMNVSLHDEQN